VTFGLVSIPVRLYPATEAKDVRFHLVDPESGRRVRYRRVVERDMDLEDVDEALGEDEAADEDEPADDVSRAADDVDEGLPDPSPGGTPGTRDTAPEVEVEYRELARAYEIEPGEQVTVTQEELRRLRPPRSRTIEIEDFVDLASIDPVYFEKSYVLAPEYGGAADKPYLLLMRALERAGRVGIGRFVLRTKPHLVAIRTRDGLLSLETLFFGDEVRDVSRVVPAPESVRIDDRELRLAEDLIDMLATDWDPSAYADTYRQELLSLIASKTPARAPEDEEAPAPAGTSGAEALMDALRRSVEEAKRRRGGASEAV
jgi:DNA end-binding protein Ku